MAENGSFWAKKRRVGRVNFNLYHYAGNSPVKYTDPDGREDFDYNKYVIDVINAHTLDLQNCIDDFTGRVGNFFHNLSHNDGVTLNFEGNFSIANISLGGTAEFKDGVLNIKGSNPKDSILDDTLGKLQEMLGSPLIITSNGLSINCNLVSFDMGKSDDGNPQVGLSLSLPVKLPEGFDLSAGFSVSVPTDYGPCATSANPSPEMRQRARQSEYLKNPMRFW